MLKSVLGLIVFGQADTFRMQLPFLKESKWPRIAKPMDEKLMNASFEDKLEEHCIGELMEAVEAKDHARFRSAIEALVLNLFEEATDAAPAGQE